MSEKSLKRFAYFSILTALLLFVPIFSFAGETTSIKIACVIPAIPGENVPLVEESITIQDPEEINMEQELSQSPSMFQKDEEILRKVKGEKTLLKVKTIYSR